MCLVVVLILVCCVALPLSRSVIGCSVSVCVVEEKEDQEGQSAKRPFELLR